MTTDPEKQEANFPVMVVVVVLVVVGLLSQIKVGNVGMPTCS